MRTLLVTLQKALILIPMLLAFGSRMAQAQNTPSFEIAAVYNGMPRVLGRSCVGFGGTVSFNLNGWLGGVGDVGACWTGHSGSFDTRTNFLFGPRVSYRRTVTPYAQVLFGALHVSSSQTFNAIKGNAFALTAGTGFEFRLTDRFAIRLIQAEFMKSYFDAGDREDVRIQSGLVFSIGKK